MTYQLRPYQQDCVDAAIKWLKSTTDYGLIEAYTASGKSLIIAEIARIITGITGKKVLVLQPNKELLTQNAAKFELTGEPYSIFSASKRQKSVEHNVVFGTALTIRNYLDQFCGKFCLVILDEADASLTPTILGIIASIKEKNPNLRVLGLTSSPYKLGQGYIYKIDANDNPMPSAKIKNPFFTKQIAHIPGRMLLEMGYVSPVTIGAINESYDTSNLKLNGMGQFTAESIDRAFIGKGRKTSSIIADIVNQSKDRNSVLIFAATQKHAEECYSSLPPELSNIVTDQTSARDRERIVREFTDCKLKYLVNVMVFTRGTDFPRLDVIALLRATESSALLHQVIGRGVRIAEGKKDCLLLDYAANIENHHPDDDLFNPVITAWNDKESTGMIIAQCEQCFAKNEFSKNPDYDGLGVDAYGYVLDLDGNRIFNGFQPIPAHYGRRCGNLILQPNGTHERCTYYWSFKECPSCKADNDIAARYCRKCKAELIDPNRLLVSDFKARKRDPYQLQIDKVLAWHHQPTLSKEGNSVLKVDFVTEYRNFSVWFQPESASDFLIKQYDALIKATYGLQDCPKTVTYRKNKNNDFFKILAYNQPPDTEPAP